MLWAMMNGDDLQNVGHNLQNLGVPKFIVILLCTLWIWIGTNVIMNVFLAITEDGYS